MQRLDKPVFKGNHAGACGQSRGPHMGVREPAFEEGD